MRGSKYFQGSCDLTLWLFSLFFSVFGATGPRQQRVGELSWAIDSLHGVGIEFFSSSERVFDSIYAIYRNYVCSALLKIISELSQRDWQRFLRCESFMLGITRFSPFLETVQVWRICKWVYHALRIRNQNNSPLDLTKRRGNEIFLGFGSEWKPTGFYSTGNWLSQFTRTRHQR